jgi:hypothetical protein
MDLPADFLFQFGSPIGGGRLSVYLVDDPSNLGQIERIITAFVATRPPNRFFDPLEYVLFDQIDLEQDGFIVDSTPGDTPDETVNAWHRDISDVSIRKLLSLFSKAWFSDLRHPLTPLKLKRIARDGQRNVNFDSWANDKLKGNGKAFKKKVNDSD